ncbi:DMT family transporter [Coralliovum pocilloporae]|uniref:DMT family transporter n=1 Tax=Coralliovum pocilloporae TaxID=3066369 RepID=UPI0033072502
MSESRPGLREYAFLVLLAAIWGASFMFTELAIETIPPATTTILRVGLGALTLLVIVRVIGQSLPRGRIWIWIFAAGFFGNALPFTLIAWGQQQIDSGLAAILMALMPLTTILLAHALTDDEKMTPAKLMGVLFGLAGLVVLIGPSKLLLLGGETISQLAVAFAASCYGLNAIITKKLVHLPRRAMVASVLLAGFILLLPVSAISDQPWTLQPSWTSLWAIVVLGIFQTALATLMMMTLISWQGASFFAQINFLIPLFGVFWGALFLAERPSANAWLALVLILIGIAITRGMVPFISNQNRTKA